MIFYTYMFQRPDNITIKYTMDKSENKTTQYKVSANFNLKID